MIRHFVLVKFRKDAAADTVATLFAELANLQRSLDGVLDFHAGKNISVETDLIRGNHHAFWFDFADVAARDAYLIDPRHVAAGQRLVAHTVGGVEGVTVVDLEF